MRHAKLYLHGAADRIDAGVHVEELGGEPVIGKRVRGCESVLPERELAEIALVDVDDDLRLAARRKHEQLLARLRDRAGSFFSSRYRAMKQRSAAPTWLRATSRLRFASSSCDADTKWLSTRSLVRW